ncbi:MAG: hypothetical protein GJ676_05690 [Rhodobacteraceae bacterium]|nr:hypothetical protein [Paracoccaceae bacterium]
MVARIGISGGNDIDEPIPVSVDHYVLASGLKSETRAQLTLQLEPKPDGNGDYGLQSWPQDISEGLRDRVELVFVPLRNSAALSPLSPSSEDEEAVVLEAEVQGLPSVAGDGAADSRERKDRLREAAQLWKRCLGSDAPIRDARAEAEAKAQDEGNCNGGPNLGSEPGIKELEPGRWGDLVEALKVSQENEGISASDTLKSGSAAVQPLEQEHFGLDGQVLSAGMKKREPIAGVLPVPHADLALALDQQRAHELCLSLAEAHGDPGCRAEAEEKCRTALPADDLYAKVREILDADQFTVKHRSDLQEAFGNTIDLPEEAKVNSFTKTDLVNAVRRALKLREYKTLNQDLGIAREPTAKAYCDEASRLANGTCGQEPQEQDALCPKRAHDRAAREEAFAKAEQVQTYATWPQYKHACEAEKLKKQRTDPVTGREPVKPYNEMPIVQRYAAIKSDPVLARAFGLTVDLEVDIEGLEDGFYVVAARLNDKVPKAQAGYTWTLLQVAKTRTGGEFWPATEYAAAQHLSARQGARPASQSGGLLALSDGACGADASLPRFDLTSIDLRTATDSEFQRRQARRTKVNSTPKLEPGQRDQENTGLKDADDLSLGPRILTGGLTFLMRTAGTQAAIHLARRDGRKQPSEESTPDVVLDADDLTTGVRPIIGLPTAGHRIRWYPLTAREIKYGTSGDADAAKAIQGLVTAILPDKGRKNALMDGYQSGATRLLPAGNGQQEAMVEEALTTWDGSPMGVDVTSGTDASRDIQIFGRTQKLLEKSLPALRFGVPYCTALAAVYSGGTSRQASTMRLKHGQGDPAIYPALEASASATKPFFRFLRHEKIAAPSFAIPIGHALRSSTQTPSGGPRPTGTPGPMGFETGPNMIVRTVGKLHDDVPNANLATRKSKEDPRMTKRGAPTISHRAVLVPNVPFDLAEWHGAFDTVEPNADPSSAYGFAAGSRAAKGNEQDRQMLVVTRTELERGLNNRQSVKSRTYTDFPQSEQAKGWVLGDAVLKTAGRYTPASGVPSQQVSDAQVNRFFPDPFATQLVFAIRRKGEADYLDGGPLIYDVQPADAPHDRLPVIVTVQAGPREARTKPVRSVNDIVSVGPESAARKFCMDAAGDGFASILNKNGVAAKELRLLLRPGEDFEIDTWVLPARDALAREHALIQSLAAFLCNCGQQGSQSARAAMVAGAKERLPATFSLSLVAHLNNLPVEDVGYVAPGGLAALDNSALKALGRAVSDTLRKTPLPELVGFTTLSAVHASNRAASKPVAPPAAEAPFDADNGQLPALDMSNATPRPMRATRPSRLDQSPKVALSISAPRSTHLILDGAVPFDAMANDVVEIVADVTLPGSSTFDDKNRGRSLQNRRRGAWPPLRTQDGSPRTYLNEAGEEILLYRDAEDLFGFKVRQDGRVSFDTARVTLLRVEGLPRDLPGGLLDLRALFLDAGPGKARIAHRHVFPDGKSRRMSVRVNALSRTLDDMRTAARVVSAGDPWLSEGVGEGLVYTEGDHIPAEPVPAEYQCNLSEQVEIFLPATIRPEKPNAKTPVPLLDASTKPLPGGDGLVHHRSASVRIPLGREWFSSGEDELLGIVLWPPALGRENGTTVKIPDRYDGGSERLVDLDAMSGADLKFSDDDLGPGGPFISRRGSDPVRGGMETEPVLSASALADLSRSEPDIRRAVFVPDVLMPLDQGDRDKDEGEEKAGAAGVPPMRVGLAVYTPRFDVEREEWYVDVTLDPANSPDGFVRFGLVRYQPHAIPELRCSPPVVQWAQPLSARTAEVKRTGAGIRVEVTGPASRGRVPLEFRDTPLAHGSGVNLNALNSEPAMRLTLFKEHRRTVGDVRREGVKRKKSTNELLTDADWVLVLPQQCTTSETTWRHTIDLRDYDVPETDVEGLKLLIEEIEHFRPATYSDEPVETALHAQWRTRFQETGPRFSATIDLGWEDAI